MELGSEQSATAHSRRQQRIEVVPMKVNELADASFELLRARSALPSTSEMFPEPFHAARRQLAIGRENEILISWMSISKPHTSPFSRTGQTCQGPLQRNCNPYGQNIHAARL
jgi:hypothetical protein